MIASVSVAIATASSPAPAMSGSARRPGARLSTSRALASRQTVTPIGMLMTNTSRQSDNTTSPPPSDGPMPAATAPVADHSATAWLRRAAG